MTGEVQLPEIMTVAEVAELLRFDSNRRVYELTRVRARVTHERPLPVIRIGSTLRFRRSDVLAWIDDLAKEAA